MEFFHDSFKKLVHHRQRCIANSGNYVEEKMQVTEQLISRIIYMFRLLNYPYFKVMEEET